MEKSKQPSDSQCQDGKEDEGNLEAGDGAGLAGAVVAASRQQVQQQHQQRQDQQPSRDRPNYSKALSGREERLMIAFTLVFQHYRMQWPGCKEVSYEGLRYSVDQGQENEGFGQVMSCTELIKHGMSN